MFVLKPATLMRWMAKLIDEMANEDVSRSEHA